MGIEQDISAYINDRMTTEQRAAFQQQMQDDPDLANEVKSQQTIAEVFDTLLEDDLRDHLDTLPKEDSSKPSRWWTLISAILVGLLVFASFMFFGSESDQLTEQQIFAEYYRVPVNKDQVRSGDTKTISDYDQAKLSFYLGELEDSRQLIDGILPTLTGGDSIKTIKRLSGHIAFQQKSYEKAISEWAGVTDGETDYNRALAYYLLGQKAKAKAILAEATDEDSKQLLAILNQ